MKVKRFSLLFLFFLFVVYIVCGGFCYAGRRRSQTSSLIDKDFLDFEEDDLDSTTVSEDILYRSDYPSSLVDCECGVRNPGYTPRPIKIHYSRNLLLQARPFVIDGTELRRSEFPWLAALTKYQPRKPNWKVICGANLINSLFLVTVAHCLNGRHKEAMEIVLNARELDDVRNDHEAVRYKIKNFHIHPLYNRSTNEHDIALVELKTPVNLVSQKAIIRPLCLPDNRKDFANEIGTVAGWGYTSAIKKNSPYPLKADLPIWRNSDCLRTRLSGTGRFTENMLCAGYKDGGRDACINDSGGGLVVNQGRKNVLAGLVSWGVGGCAAPNAPGVYTRVGNYANWIREETYEAEWCSH